MNEVYIDELLSQLCLIYPNRFSVSYVDINEPDWWFHDKENDLYETAFGLSDWLFDMLNELNITTMNNLNGNSWRESVLNIIIDKFKEKRESEPISDSDRYKLVRTLNVNQFADLVRADIHTDKNFDDLVDELIKEAR